VSPPVSEAPSTAHDRALTDEMVQLLRDNGRFESEAETALRVNAIRGIQDLVQEWVQDCCKALNYAEDMRRNIRARVRAINLTEISYDNVSPSAY